jgi:small subunit ribosomal protein S16
VSVKIRLKRLGKIRAPYYRIVVADSRTKRDGRVIEEIGKYHPTEEPSFIEVNSERAQYWLSVGAQPTEQVAALLKLSGDWGIFKGEKGAKSTIRTKEAPVAFEADTKKKPVLKPKAEKAAPKVEAPVAAAPADDDAAGATGDDLAADVATEAVEAPVAEAPVEDAPAAEAPVEEAPVEEAAVAEDAPAAEPAVEEAAAETPAETVTDAEVAVDEAEGSADEAVSNEPEAAAEAEAAADAEAAPADAEADKA